MNDHEQATQYEQAIRHSTEQVSRALKAGYPQYNIKDKPPHYEGRRRYGEETSTNLASENPVVYLAIEKVLGIGDSVIAASMSFRTRVAAAKDFSGRIEGVEIFPERTYLTSESSVRMRTAEGNSTAYRIDPVKLS